MIWGRLKYDSLELPSNIAIFTSKRADQRNEVKKVYGNDRGGVFVTLTTGHRNIYYNTRMCFWCQVDLVYARVFVTSFRFDLSGCSS